MNTISLIIKKIWIFLLFIIVSLLIFTIFLIKGIKIDSLESKIFSLSGLYIKLDKKLILEVENLEIHKQKNTKNSSDEMINLAHQAKYIELFFKKIDLKNISYDDFNLTMLYKDDLFYINTTHSTLDLQFLPYENGVNLIVKKLFLKDYKININGNINADFKKEIYHFSGEFDAFGLNGNLNFTLDDNLLTYNLNSVKTSSLEGVKNELLKIKFDPEITNWIYGYTRAKEYFLDSFYGKFDLKTKNFFPKEMRASGHALNASVKFHKNLKPITSDKINIEFKNESLFFYPENAKFDGNKAQSGGIRIYDIFSDKAGISINIRTNSLYTKAINNILKAYKVNLNIEQKSGLMDAVFNLKLDFNSLNLDYNGIFIIKNSKINLFGGNFYTKFAKIILNNNILKFENSNLAMDIFNIAANGSIDISKESGEFIGSVDLKIDEIIELKNHKTRALLDFKKDAILDLVDDEIKINFGNFTQIEANNLQKFAKNSKLMQNLKIKNGDLSLKTRDFSIFKIALKNAKFSSNLIKKDGNYYTEDDFFITYNNDILVETKSELLQAKRFKNGNIEIKINDLDLEIEQNDGEEMDLNINFFAKNSNLILKGLKRVLKFNSYKGKIGKNLITFNAKTQNGSIDFYQDKNSMGLSGENLSHIFINDLANHNAFKDGAFFVLLNGSSLDNFKGEIRIENSHIIDLVGYHQLLSFLNSIPSLLIFKNPDFNEKGFTIKNGIVRFTKNKDIINIKAINLDGSSADILGQGIVNLENKSIDFDLELRLLKAASSIIGKIPLVNQILLGSDRSISTIIKGSGTLDNPNFSTQILQDTLKTPYNIIKNILELPFNLFN